MGVDLTPNKLSNVRHQHLNKYGHYLNSKRKSEENVEHLRDTLPKKTKLEHIEEYSSRFQKKHENKKNKKNLLLQ